MEEDQTIGTQLERWLTVRAGDEPREPVFWTAHGSGLPSDCVEVRGVEHLAVLSSTTSRSDDVVCAVSGPRGRSGRSVDLIGLVGRSPRGWAVVARDPEDPTWAGDVQRRGYPHTDYDSFGLLAAAEISWAWVTSGRLPDGLEIRLRQD